MIDAPPFDPPYFFIEKTEQGVRVIETRADGSRQESMMSSGEAAWLSAETSSTSSAPARPDRRKNVQTSSGMPPGSTLLAVPFSEKDAAKKLGARWNAERRSWYVPPGTDISLFERWHSDKS